jgi:hypothetical protein
MKKLILIGLLIAAFSVTKAQDSGKWYEVRKDTTIYGLEIEKLYVCITRIDFRYATGVTYTNINICFQYKAQPFVQDEVQFPGLIVECDPDNTIGITQEVNKYLSNRYNTPLSNIIEL